MGRWLALGSEILAGRDNPNAKVGLPHSIDDGARRSRGITRCQPARKGESRRLAVFPGIILWQWMQKRGDAGLYQGGRLQEVAPGQNVRFPRNGSRSKYQLRRAFGVLLPGLRNLVVFHLPLRNGGAPIAKYRLHLQGSALGGRNRKYFPHVLG